jgi:hypothetical protein
VATPATCEPIRAAKPGVDVEIEPARVTKLKPRTNPGLAGVIEMFQ